MPWKGWSRSKTQRGIQTRYLTAVFDVVRWEQGPDRPSAGHDRNTLFVHVFGWCHVFVWRGQARPRLFRIESPADANAELDKQLAIRARLNQAAEAAYAARVAAEQQKRANDAA